MTEKLRALLDERASAPTFDLPDLDAVRSAGLRRRRRSRAGVSAAGLVATAAATGLVLSLVDGGDEPADTTPVATDPARTGPLEPSWAVGSVIHEGDRQTEVGHPVKAYVRTSLGYVTFDDEGRVWSVLDGTVTQLGTVDGEFTQLVSDPGSSRVAWVDDQSSVGFVTYDLAADSDPMTYVPLPDDGPDRPGDRIELYAMDGDVVYARAESQVVRVDLASGAQQVLTTLDDSDGGFDAAGGRTVAVTYGPEATLAEVGPPAGPPDSSFEVSGGDPVLSPDGSYVAIGGDEGPVYDVSTGQEVPLDAAGFFEPAEWLDDTTLIVVAETAPGTLRATVLACDVTTGACRSGAPDLGPFDDLEETFSMPVGTR